MIIEFGDYQCPFCREAETALRQLRKMYPDNVALVFRHFPIATHQYAYQAARISECAATQGRFDEVHRQLFDTELSRIDLVKLARETGVPDTTAFLACSRAAAAVDRIDRDVALAKNLGLRGTPAFIVDGTYLGAPPTLDGWREIVERRLVAAGGGHE
jgi:protein-disulfide isomerase